MPSGKRMQMAAAGATGGATSLFTWGAGGSGANGDGTTTTRTSPVIVAEEGEWLAGRDTFARGNLTGMGIKTDYTLWTWGEGEFGQNGQSGAFPRRKSIPTQLGTATNWVKVSIGYKAGSAVNSDGELFTWGRNFNGMLAQNNNISAISSPVQVAGTDWAIPIMGSHNSLFIKTNGTLWAAGSGYRGAIGDGTSTTKSSPIQLGARTDWVDATVAGRSCGALTSAGKLYTWGQANVSGQTGHGNKTDLSIPTQVGALTTWSQISGGWDIFVALKTDGTLWSWGNGAYGQLGLGDTTSRSSPVQIGALTDWAQVGACGFSGWGIKTDGTLWGWGKSTNAAWGSGNKSSPVQIGTDTTWTYVVKMGSRVDEGASAQKT